MYMENIIPPKANVMFHAESVDDIPSGAVAASKLYLILYQSLPIDTENGDTYIVKDWEYVRGREAAYKSIVDRLNNMDDEPINLLGSLVIVASYKRTIEEPISVYDFMKKMQEQKKIIEDVLIDIDQYIDFDTYPELYPDDGYEPKCGQGNTNIPYTEQTAEYGGEV